MECRYHAKLMILLWKSSVHQKLTYGAVPDRSLLPSRQPFTPSVLRSPADLAMQVSNYFAPTDKAKQEGFNAYLTDKNAERLATALCRMRGAALKLGQMLSIQDEGVLPPQVNCLHTMWHLCWSGSSLD